MTGFAAWALVALGLAAVVIRRRSVAVGLVTAEALILAGIALAEAGDAAEVVAGAALGLRGIGLAALFFLLIHHTRERRPVRAHVPPALRAAVAIAFALALTWIVPSLGLESRDAERAVLALVAFGVSIVATRRATLFHILGIVTVENGLALAALEQPGGSSLLIELGVAFDLVLIAAVASLFHTRIFRDLGTGDSFELRSLHDR
jgi:hydrogenase-4 membrane subunit HyfE